MEKTNQKKVMEGYMKYLIVFAVIVVIAVMFAGCSSEQASVPRSSSSSTQIAPPAPQPQMITCTLCNGTGRCSVCKGNGLCDRCGGRGWKFNINNQPEECDNCKGTGKCTWMSIGCNGTGLCNLCGGTGKIQKY
jgi:hypothetical protein